MWIENWKQAWRLFSVQASAFFATVAYCWTLLTEAQRDAILGLVGLNGPAYAALVAFVSVIIFRLKSQQVA